MRARRTVPPRVLMREMADRFAPRPRHYVSPAMLTALWPVLRYSETREAFLLRAVGGRVGPVLRPDRRARRRTDAAYAGPERRRTLRAASS